MALTPRARFGVAAALALTAAVAACAAPAATVTMPAGSTPSAAAPATAAQPSGTASTGPVVTAATAADAASFARPETAKDLGGDADTDPAQGEPEEDANYFEDDGLDIQVRNFKATGGYDEDNDGSEDEEGSMYIEQGDEDAHEIAFEQDDQPEMSDKEDQITITDKTENVTRTFSNDQVGASYTMTDTTEPVANFQLLNTAASVSLKINPDGTVLVNGQLAPDGKAAAQMASQIDLVKATPSQTFAALYARYENKKDAAPTTRGADTDINKPGAAQSATSKILDTTFTVVLTSLTSLLGFLGK